MVSIGVNIFRRGVVLVMVLSLSGLSLFTPTLNASGNEITDDPRSHPFGGLVEGDTGSLGISWTAPGDDDYSGRADHYVIKYSTDTISQFNWEQAVTEANPPVPLDAGEPQSLVISELVRGEHYYIGIKAFDEANNPSELSNVAVKFASGIKIPSPAGVEIDTLSHTALVMAYSVESEHPVFYEFALDTNQAFSNPVLGIDFLADTLARSSFGGLADMQTYYWRVCAVAVDHSDSSNWSEPDSFRLSGELSSPLVAVTMPNGGESWQPGSVQSIIWADSGNVNIVGNRLEYSTDGGVTWDIVRDWEPGNPHEFSLVVPNVSSNHCRIKVLCRDDNDNTGFDISDRDFTVGEADPQPTVTLTSPDGRERWDALSSHQITWADSDDLGITAYRLEYSTDAGSNWTIIQDWTAGDPHEYSWTLPNFPTRQARVRVSCRDADNNEAVDISNRNFTIRDIEKPHIRLMFPDGGDTLEVNADTSIVWQASDNIGIDSFMVELSLDNGGDWDTLIDWQSGNPQIISWDVPVRLAGECLMRVSCKDFDDNMACDTSNSLFRIADTMAPTVDITSPGNEPPPDPDSIYISWIAQDNGVIALETAEFSTDYGDSWNMIWQDSSGESIDFWWTGPDLPSNSILRLSVIDQGGNFGYDTVSIALTDMGADSPVIPGEFMAAPSFPNPFNAATVIAFGLPRPSHVTIDIYDALGRRVTSLFDGEMGAGNHVITWNAGDHSSGVYFYIIHAGTVTVSQKMTLAK